jgi:hypothetical protein
LFYRRKWDCQLFRTSLLKVACGAVSSYTRCHFYHFSSINIRTTPILGLNDASKRPVFLRKMIREQCTVHKLVLKGCEAGSHSEQRGVLRPSLRPMRKCEQTGMGPNSIPRALRQLEAERLIPDPADAPSSAPLSLKNRSPLYIWTPCFSAITADIPIHNYAVLVRVCYADGLRRSG